MDPERLYVTYFEGHAGLGLPADEEARKMWLKIGVHEKNIIPFGMKVRPLPTCH